RPALLLLGLVAILGWQLPHLQWPEKLDASYRARASHGLDFDNHFVYFLYYLDLYPVASKAEWPPHDFSEEGARQLLERAPDKLVQDLRFTFYSGERGKTLLYLFDAWLKGEPRYPAVRPFHRLLWMLTLCGLWTSFWCVRRPLVGGLFVGLFGSNPFALYEVVVHENVHGWPVLSAGIVLALALPFFGPAPPGRRLRWVLPALTGIVLGSIPTVPTEPTLLILAPALVYLATGGLTWRVRLALVALLGVAFGASFRGWEAWFDAKDRDAKAVLVRLGGHPYPGRHIEGHQVWHPIW